MKHIVHLNRRFNCEMQLCVKEIGENEFELLENDPFDSRYVIGTIIKTKVNPNNQHEITEFVKSPRTIRKFILPRNFQKELSKIVSEISELGGICQIDMEGILTIALPRQIKTSEIDLVLLKNEIFITELV